MGSMKQAFKAIETSVTGSGDILLFECQSNSKIHVYIENALSFVYENGDIISFINTTNNGYTLKLKTANGKCCVYINASNSTTFNYKLEVSYGVMYQIGVANNSTINDQDVTVTINANSSSAANGLLEVGIDPDPNSYNKLDFTSLVTIPTGIDLDKVFKFNGIIEVDGITSSNNNSSYSATNGYFDHIYTNYLDARATDGSITVSSPISITSNVGIDGDFDVDGEIECDTLIINDLCSTGSGVNNAKGLYFDGDILCANTNSNGILIDLGYNPYVNYSSIGSIKGGSALFNTISANYLNIMDTRSDCGIATTNLAVDNIGKKDSNGTVITINDNVKFANDVNPPYLGVSTAYVDNLAAGYNIYYNNAYNANYNKIYVKSGLYMDGDSTHHIATRTISNVYEIGFDTTTGSSNINGVQTITAIGTINAGSFNIQSDKRLKKNIKSFKPKKSILDLDVKEFDLKKDKSHHIGCIAQDLQEICPEIVYENEDGYLSIEEGKIVYLLLDEVKQLKAEVEALKKQLGGK